MSYTFLPWLLEGIGAEVSRTAGLRLVVNYTELDPLPVRLLGPGAVLGFDAQVVGRTDPVDLAGAAEPNYFPFVEFAEPSFPWMFSPDAPDGRRLRPWICLVVVRLQPGVSLEPAGTDRPVPVLTIEPPAVPDHELPDLAESWAWAHVQITGAAGDPAAVLRDDRSRALARLLCPRRLRASTTYLACVVPAYAAGVAAVLAQEVPPGDAWQPGQTRVRLPVYHRFTFTTGRTGDFESLAERLHPSPAPAGVGRRKLKLGPGASVEAEGVLRLPGPAPGPVPVWFVTMISEQLSGLAGLRPPLYGGAQAGVAELPADGWIRELNLDPRHRAAAGLGARIVRERQEQLMEAAWRQAGALGEANRFLATSQLARSVGQSEWRRRLSPLAEHAPTSLLRITAPVRLFGGTGQPGPLRRLSRARGPLGPRLPDGDPQERLAALEPWATHRERVRGRIDSPPSMPVMERTDPLAPVSASPIFDTPMISELRKLGTEFVLPGVEFVPADGVLIMEQNRAFIAAFMAGLNHEMGRELLWREFPVDPKVSCFRTFWEGGRAPDLPPVDEWSLPERLGADVPGGDELVLVMRGELMRRFPDAVVYASRAISDGTRRRPVDDDRLMPLFAGSLEPDISYFGFTLTKATARGDDGGLGWFVVFQERPGQPRFGLDESGWRPDPPGEELTTAQLAWGHLVPEAELASLEHAPVLTARPVGWRFSDRPGVSWDGGSADLAVATLQRPTRVAFHARALLEEGG
ncbi:putative secreted protein [Planomonospora sphaerica]|uniref:Putative secreted protein n=1 Tax=Planomonospora sphaerica TaxID=161355 RepID=A0A161MCG4_9ACTN|nr:hypothetical protein [Planomonospora sphaerica]GAT68903.1 putative secreted protein [Planomonospora sphaerica]